MRICTVSGVLVMVLWLAPAWADNSGIVQPFAPAQETGRFSALQASNGKGRSSWGEVFGREMVLGLALTGSGAYFIKRGFDFHDEADALYRRYLDSLNPEEITQLYQRTNKRDLKSRLSWALGAVLAVRGVRILWGSSLPALHLELAPAAGGHPLAGRGAQLILSRDF